MHHHRPVGKMKQDRGPEGLTFRGQQGLPACSRGGCCAEPSHRPSLPPSKAKVSL